MSFLDLLEKSPRDGLSNGCPSNSCGAYGFSALPAGNRNNNGNFNNEGNNANFWSSTENNSNNAYNMNLNYNNENANLNNNNKNNGNSVRCVKNSEKFDWLHCELLDAYRSARKHKRNTVNQLQFERNLESNLLDLACELKNRTYELRPSICFINEKPVKREIIAADFRDRVVHHLLFNWINPIFERLFIHDSYSCRIGKGTDFAINRAKGFIVSESRNFTRECYALRLDVSGFFMSIDRNVLYRLVVEGLRRSRWRGVPDKDLCVFLVKKFVYNDPLKNAVFRSPRSAWDDLPANKSLIGLPSNQGLPIGNLTSQLFGNIYMNPLDQFVKRELKIRCYGRYVDDMLLVHYEKRVLLAAIPSIRDFLRNHLHLTLHPRKVSLQPVQNGFAFLGAYILPYRTYPSRRIMANFRDCLMHPLNDAAKQNARLVSYRGLFGHYQVQGTFFRTRFVKFPA